MEKLSRILIPVSYSATDRFDMDLAISIPPLARLAPAADLAAMDPQSYEFKFLERKMVRERNRVCRALAEASELIDRTLKSVAYPERKTPGARTLENMVSAAFEDA